MDFDYILNWKLLQGSHDFPGPEGGTCINEAAIVAAGFKYKSISNYRDVPECFCPVLSDFLIILNDYLDFENRQELIKYIWKLPGSKDKKAEQSRLEKLLEINAFLKKSGVVFIKQATWIEAHLYALLACVGAGVDSERIYITDVIGTYKDQILEKIDEAFAIGNQAEPLDINLIQERLEKAKVLVD
jgi:hypothetical protein